MLDYKGDVVPDVGTDKLMAAMVPANTVERQTGKRREGVPVHLLDVHLERGMHCADCHFSQDSHGNTKLYGEVRAAIEIRCEDCHGSASKRAELVTTGPASPPGGHNLAILRTPFGKPRFERRWERGQERVYQNSVVEPDLWLGGRANRRHHRSGQRPLQRPLAHGEDCRIRPRRQAHVGRQTRRMPMGPSTK